MQREQVKLVLPKEKKKCNGIEICNSSNLYFAVTVQVMSEMSIRLSFVAREKPFTETQLSPSKVGELVWSKWTLELDLFCFRKLYQNK